ncbi:transforming growth factor beta receptor type 3-like isoform X1 [Tachypleus tridentatus]|uniref:transforming growth factor beta receptor type 3-like isoform X1 n=1 Tax=Tachypleus tridentatus TaxID=6853 RepID=UPI003FD506A3
MEFHLISAMILLITAIFSFPTISSFEADSSRSCTVTWHFQSQYVTPLLEKTSYVTGCTSQDITRNSKEIHVIRLESAGFNTTSSSDFLPRVFLKVKPRIKNSIHVGPLVVILNTPTPVMWQLEVEQISNNSRFIVFITHESQVISSTPLRLTVRKKHTSSLKKILNWARGHFGALTSLSRIRMANSVVLKIGVDGKFPQLCDDTMEGKVDNLEASFIQPQPASGCTASQNIGPSNRDVHIIKIRSTTESDIVVIHVQPQGAVKRNSPNKPIIIKDLVLVLKSESAVRWRIDSWGVQGIVHVVAEHQVLPGLVPSFQLVKVQVQSLPNDTEDLVSAVTDIFGNVSTVMETNVANRINIMIVGENAVTDQRNVQSDGESPKDRLSIGQVEPDVFQSHQSDISATVSSPSPWNRLHREKNEFPLNLKGFSKTVLSTKSREIWNGRVTSSLTNTFRQKWRGNYAGEKLAMEMRNLMNLECHKDRLKLTFPKSSSKTIVTKLNGNNTDLLEVTLQDQACKATTNVTHFILETSFHNCGFNIVSDGGRYFFKNQLLFWSPAKVSGTSESISSDHYDSFIDDEDMFNSEDGSGLGYHLRQALESHQRITQSHLIFSQSFQCAYDFISDGNIFEMVNDAQVYHMELYQDSHFRNMLQEGDGPLEVLARDNIYVKTSIDAGLDMYIVTDECWISLYNSSYHVAEDKEMLIQHSCPKHLSVGLLSAESSNTGDNLNGLYLQQGFFFQLTERWIGHDVYLYCRLAACSEKTNSPVDGIKQCIDPKEYCVGNSIKQFLESRAGRHFSTIIKGPLHVLPPQRSRSSNTENSKTPFLFKHLPPLNKHPDVSPPSDVQFKKDMCGTQNMVGVSTAAIVGIAFASFIIGVGLMAVLWFITICTDPTRKNQDHQQGGVHHHHHHRHSGYDLSGHSGSSTPSSQVPMAVT